MENGYGYGQDYGYGYGYGHGHGRGLYSEGSGVWRSLRDGDFEEEDVWAVLRERKDSNCCKVTQSNFEAQNSVKRSLPSAARMIPRTSVGGSSSGSSISNHHMSESTRGVVKQQSAPVSIPDWSKINGKKSNKSFKVHDYDDDEEEEEEEYDVDDGINDGSDSDDDEDEDMYNDKMPPHELIARRLARSQISSFSVFEGVGRTLKGRDLSKVRNAILTKTGFLE